jgi:hypothetical protein
LGGPGVILDPQDPRSVAFPGQEALDASKSGTGLVIVQHEDSDHRRGTGWIGPCHRCSVPIFGDVLAINGKLSDDFL